MAAIPFKIHNGHIGINLKISRNRIAIQILQHEHSIHQLEQKKSSIYQASIKARIAKINEMNELEAKQLDDPTEERQDEINKITEEINTGLYSDADIATMTSADEDIKVCRDEIEHLETQFTELDTRLRQIEKITVVRGNLQLESFEEEMRRLDPFSS